MSRGILPARMAADIVEHESTDGGDALASSSGGGALGVQILADIYDCDAAILDDADRIREALLEGARRAGAEIVSHSVHHFSPHGVSGVVVIAESHLAIHTWPEHRYAALDLFTCGASIRPAACFDYLRQALGGGHYETSRVRRGGRLIPTATKR